MMPGKDNQTTTTFLGISKHSKNKIVNSENRKMTLGESPSGKPHLLTTESKLSFIFFFSSLKYPFVLPGHHFSMFPWFFMLLLLHSKLWSWGGDPPQEGATPAPASVIHLLCC